MKVFRAIEPEWTAVAPETGDRVTSRVFWRDDWMNWTGTHWRRIDPIAVRAELYRRTENAIFMKETKEGPEPKPWAPNRKKIGDIEDVACAILSMDSGLDSQVWREEDHGPALSCLNGVLLLRKRTLVKHTPNYFTEYAVPMEWDKEADCPRWKGFLESVFPGDDEAKALLQEWFGYVLSGRTDMQKLLLIHGPSRSGKGTIARVLKRFFGGEKFVAGPSMSSFQSSFGLSTLIGKPLAIIPDARMENRDSSAAVERILAITGEDTIDIDRKHKALWSGKLPTRLMMLSNELPRFRDASMAIVKRFLALETKESFLGKEDPTLEGDLEAELPGILNWALDGLDCLDHQGYFTRPASTESAHRVMDEAASPVAAFVADCCVNSRDRRVTRDAMYKQWERWAEKNGEHVKTSAEFGRLLRAASPGVGDSQPRINGRKVRVYTGIGFSGELSVCDTCGEGMHADLPGNTHPSC
ncbi:phage/plasmid primase, P4 family [Streptomyces ovatisporus]|uniref:Phage/plasmid primase, P4 family n=1 Tax=Streptomyces ovatisporus TaxID=1128682 RepID=A0ABV9ADG4_9ACTN